MQQRIPLAGIVDMPPSSYRPSPPSSRPAPPREQTLRSVPDPPKETSEMAKKKRAKSPESIAKLKATLAAKKAAKEAALAPAVAGPKLNELDLFLDIIELCERAKKGLTKSQRMRLKAALNERLA